MTGGLAAALMLTAVWVTFWPTRPRLIPPLPGQTAPFAHGPFTARGDATDHADLPPGMATRGSWVNGDAFTGTYRSGWYQARPRVTLLVSGYPRAAGNLLEIEIRGAEGAVQQMVYRGSDPREYWRPWSVVLPAGARAFRIVAIDGTAKFRGWLAVSQPAVTGLRLAFLPEAPRALLAFAGEAVLLLGLALVLIRVMRPLGVPSGLLPFVAAAGIAALGYLAFWCYFASPLLGRIYSWTVLIGIVLILLTSRADDHHAAEWAPVFGLAGVIGVAYVALTCLFGNAPFSHLAASRFVINLPVDNEIPRIFADRLWAGQSPRHLIGDWLSSDRPPLQTGWLLLTRPVMSGLGFDSDTVGCIGGVWFQLLWVPALWALLRRLGGDRRVAAAMTAAVTFTGFQLFYTIYTWPKLGAAALVLGAFVLWQPAPDVAPTRRRFAAGGVCAALGMLSHGGVAFSLVGLAPLALYWLWRNRRLRRPWLMAVFAFTVTYAPWVAYQNFYEPPGNRLLKWHLAGVIPIDSRSFAQALIDSYRHLGWRGALANRWSNLQLQWTGHFGELLHFQTATDILSRRGEELTFTGRIFCWWLPAALLLPWLLWRRRKSPDGIVGRACLWWLAGWLAWLALMFLPDSARSHQGTLITQVLGFALLMWSAWSWRRIAFYLLAGLQAAEFLTQWVTASPRVVATPNLLPAVIAAAAGAILVVTIFRGALPGRGPPVSDAILP